MVHIEDMTTEENLSKDIYKVFLRILKIIPMLLSLITLLDSVLSYFHIESALPSFIGGISLLPLIFLYITSYVFKYCEYHRIFLHYIVIIWVLNIIDCYIGIPVDKYDYLCLLLIITGICLFLILYLYVKTDKRTSTKDYK